MRRCRNAWRVFWRNLSTCRAGACDTLRYALDRYAWLMAFANAACALNLTLALSLLLNLNFILVDLLLNFIITGVAD